MLTWSRMEDSAVEGNPEPDAYDGHLRERGGSGSPKEWFALGACE